MKKQSLLFFFAISLFFVGCTIEKRHYNSGYHVEWLSQKGKVKKAEPIAQPEKENEQSLAFQQKNQSTTNEVFAETPIISEVVVTPVTTETAASTPVKQTDKQRVAKAVKKNFVRNEVKAERVNSSSVEKGFTAQSSISDIDSPSSPLAVELIVLIILAIFIPPLAVFLHSGIGTPFWISILLWLLFILPGVIYALLVVTDTI